MITIKQSPCADTRTCDVASVSKEQLLESSKRHIGDVGKALGFFRTLILESADVHDYDKIRDIDSFYSDFKTKFEETGWWDNHRQISRHHLNYADGVPSDVNLIDVLEYISDCVMAGMARSGTVTPVTLDPAVLQKAFENTAALLKAQIVVEKTAD
jgi:hypothetical protein